MDLGVAGIGECGAPLVGAPGGGHVGSAGIRREVVDVAVAAGAEQDGVGGVGRDLAGDEVAGDDPLGMAVDKNEVEHLGVLVHLHAAEGDLGAQGGVGAEQELLAGLSLGVEGAGDLGAAEGAVREFPAVFAGEGDALGDALVDDVPAHLGKAVDIRLAGAEVSPLDGVVEEAPDAVAVVLVVLGGIDASLRGDGVGAAGAVVKAEGLHLVAELGEGGGGGGAGESCADDDDLELALVGGADELRVVLERGPLLLNRTVGDFGIKNHGRERS